MALSRPRSHLRLGHHGPVPKELQKVLALGPDAHIRAEIARLKDLDQKTRPKTRAAQG